MTCRFDKVDTCMDTVIDYVHTIDLILGLEICIKPLLNVFDDGSPGIIVVDKIAKSWSINDCQSESHTVLLDICTDGLDGNRLWNYVETRTLSFSGRIEGGVEQGVDKCGFSETRLACSRLMIRLSSTMLLPLTDDHYVETETLSYTLSVPLIWQVCETNIAGQLAPNDISHVAGQRSGSLGVLGAHCLRYVVRYGIALLDIGGRRLRTRNGCRRPSCLR